MSEELYCAVCRTSKMRSGWCGECHAYTPHAKEDKVINKENIITERVITEFVKQYDKRDEHKLLATEFYWDLITWVKHERGT